MRGLPSGPGPRGVAWVSTTLPSPSPSTIVITTVRGSGQPNSARTGTPSPGPTRKVTSTTNLSSSSLASTGGADATVRCANEYGWNHEPCHGSRRLATTSPGSHTPTSRVTAATLPAAAGRGASTGAGSGSSPPGPSSRTHASTPSSWPGSGSQPYLPLAPTGSPCHRHTTVSQTTRPCASGAPRCGHSPGPTSSCPAASRHATSSRPATRVPNGRSGRTSLLAANANQLPDGRASARLAAASISAGAASRNVGSCADHSSRGVGWTGQRAYHRFAIPCSATSAPSTCPAARPSSPVRADHASRRRAR